MSLPENPNTAFPHTPATEGPSGGELGRATPSGVANSPPTFAGLWIRFAAHMVDGLLVLGGGVAGAVIRAVIGALTGSIADGAVVGYAVVVVASILYPAIFESSQRQATPGKRAVGIIVTDTRGQRISFGRALGRTVAKLLNQLTLGIGWIMAGVTSQKRGLHDFVAGTLVVRPSPTP